MFDFDEALRRWRNSLNGTEAILSQDIAELETHLLEEVARLEGAGLAQDEAFVIACRRLGSPDALSAEYERADPGSVWRKRILWAVLGMVMGSFAPQFLSALTRIMALAAASALSLSGRATFLLSATVQTLALGMVVLFLVSVAQGKVSGLVDRLSARYQRPRALFTDILAGVVLMVVLRLGESRLLVLGFEIFPDMRAAAVFYLYWNLAAMILLTGISREGVKGKVLLEEKA